MSRTNTKDGTRRLRTLRERLAWVRKECFGARGQAAFARALGLAPTTYAHYEKDTDPPPEVVLEMVRKVRLNPRWLRNGQGTPFLPEGAAVPEESDVLHALGALMEQGARTEPRVAETVTEYRPAAPAPPDWKAWLAGRGCPQGQVLRLDHDAHAPLLPRGTVVGIDGACAPEEFRAAKNVLVLARAAEGRSLLRLLSEVRRGVFLFVPFGGAAEATPIVWSSAESEAFPVIGRVVFLFADHLPLA